jgi:thiosulfate dehydrogenase [quinone] large subunit
MHTSHVGRKSRYFRNPHAIESLVSHGNAGYLWFVLRLYVGSQWLAAGWHKLAGASSIGWVRDGTVGSHPMHHGDKLLAFWQEAVAPSKTAMPQVGFRWYRDFLLFLIQHHSYSWFTYLIAGGEFLTGLALMLGAFTIVAALAGATMNFNYMLAGSASINPALFAAEVLLILAWKNAGYVGLDRWLLPMLGMPWQLGRLFRSPAHRAGSRPGSGPAVHAGRRVARDRTGRTRLPRLRPMVWR